MEYSQLQPVVQEYKKYLQLVIDKKSAEEMLSDPEMKEMAKEELAEIKEALEDFEVTLQRLYCLKIRMIIAIYSLKFALAPVVMKRRFCRRSIPHVLTLCRTKALAGRNNQSKPG